MGRAYGKVSGAAKGHGRGSPPRAAQGGGDVILGVAGPYGAGKGEVIDYLRSRSFVTFSLSDVLREELRSRGEPENRERMIELGRELRERFGPGVLAERLADRFGPENHYAVDSIRHPAEVEVLRRRAPHFRLIWVDADERVRLERLLRRARPGDPRSLEELRRLEGRESDVSDPSSQQLPAVRALADEVVWNEGDLGSLHEQVRRILERCAPFDRPGWDTYFMDIARVVASRSNCVKRKVAAVITVDRRIISTGYNGTPRGVRNCNEGGCPRCNAFGESGSALDQCLCSHGEENAITQAAYHGVTVRGGTLYTTCSPCLICTKMIINAGIAEVVYNARYPLGDVALELLREAGVQVRQARDPAEGTGEGGEAVRGGCGKP